MKEDEKWMKIAIAEANKAFKKGEVPVGAALIQNGKLIAKSYNQPILTNDPTAHAEIQVIRKSGKILQNYRLIDSTLYVTLEPCSMCIGAIIHARVKRIVFGAYDNKTPMNKYNNTHKKIKSSNHKIIINGGVLENECINLLQSFFKLKR